MNDTLLWYATRGAGAVSLLLLSGAVVLGVLGRARFEAPGWPRFLTTALHRNLSLTALTFLALHVVTAVTDPFTHLGWAAAVLPFSSWYRTFWLGLGTVAAELMAAIVATSLVRRLVGQGAWRAVHWLAYACWPIAFAHGLGTGTDAGSSWMLGVDIVAAGAVVAAAGGRLFVRPSDPLSAERARFRALARREVNR